MIADEAAAAEQWWSSSVFHLRYAINRQSEVMCSGRAVFLLDEKHALFRMMVAEGGGRSLLVFIIFMILTDMSKNVWNSSSSTNYIMA